MNTEKIAFLFPYSPDKNLTGGVKSPLLAFDFDDFPAIFDLSISVFFVGMTDGQAYYLSAQIFKCDEQVDTSVSQISGVWVRPKDTQGKPSDIAASIDLTVENCRFEGPATYFIETRLFKDDKAIHKNCAYFKVSKEND
ncbi:hypothetical protein [Pectobacterium brasiliense]|uniref:hypothetical protein n=1 Tax=Pectobacterium brasiliense TaxID=180957 RepID=UPI003988078B